MSFTQHEDTLYTETPCKLETAKFVKFQDWEWTRPYPVPCICYCWAAVTSTHLCTAEQRNILTKGGSPPSDLANIFEKSVSFKTSVRHCEEGVRKRAIEHTRHPSLSSIHTCTRTGQHSWTCLHLPMWWSLFTTFSFIRLWESSHTSRSLMLCSSVICRMIMNPLLLF